MNKLKFISVFHILCISISLISCKNNAQNIEDTRFISYVLNPKKQELNFYLKNDNNVNFSNFKKLKSELEKQNKKLVFATNGGMFNKTFNPQGIYIQNGKLISKLDTIKKQRGNFYLLPNGVFYLTNDGKPIICKTENFRINNKINFATQSGPMLVIDGSIHPKLTKGSTNLNIRNGVGILPNGNLLFAMSKEKINFYDFAFFFKVQGCENALYLDGFVSKTYLPSENWKQLDGNFGIIIAEIENMN